MRQSEVAIYDDPTTFEELGEQAIFPNSTQLMVYNALLHRYVLTPLALEHYGVKVGRRTTHNPQQLCDMASKKVYDYIQYKAGFQRYQVMMYRIAVAPKTIYPDQYFMRKQFEQALIDQVRFIIENGDSARVGRYSVENGEQMPLKPDDIMRDNTDMSPETIRTLDTLNLTRWFAMQNNGRGVQPDITKY